MVVAGVVVVDGALVVVVSGALVVDGSDVEVVAGAVVVLASVAVDDEPQAAATSMMATTIERNREVMAILSPLRQRRVFGKGPTAVFVSVPRLRRSRPAVRSVWSLLPPAWLRRRSPIVP